MSFLVKQYAELQEFPGGALFIPPIVVIDTLVGAIRLDSEKDNAELADALIEIEKRPEDHSFDHKHMHRMWYIL